MTSRRIRSASATYCFVHSGASEAATSAAVSQVVPATSHSSWTTGSVSGAGAQNTTLTTLVPSARVKCALVT